MAKGEEYAEDDETATRGNDYSYSKIVGKNNDYGKNSSPKYEVTEETARGLTGNRGSDIDQEDKDNNSGSDSRYNGSK